MKVEIRDKVFGYSGTFGSDETEEIVSHEVPDYPYDASDFETWSASTRLARLTIEQIFRAGAEYGAEEAYGQCYNEIGAWLVDAEMQGVRPAEYIRELLRSKAR